MVKWYPLRHPIVKPYPPRASTAHLSAHTPHDPHHYPVQLVLVEREAAEDEAAISRITPMNDERRAAAANAASHQAQKQAAPLAIAAGAI